MVTGATGKNYMVLHGATCSAADLRVLLTKKAGLQGIRPGIHNNIFGSLTSLVLNV